LDSGRVCALSQLAIDLDHVQTVAFAGSDEYRIVRTQEQVAGA
jgi:hypothetical protein